MTGGFPAWKEAGGQVSEEEVTDEAIAAPAAAAAAATAMAAYPAKLDLAMVKSIDEVKAALAAQAQVVDARSAGRFDGTAPEPRADLPSGHMPGVCHAQVVDAYDIHVMRSCSKSAILPVVERAGCCRWWQARPQLAPCRGRSL